MAQAEDSQWEDVIRMAVAHARPRERAEILRGLLARGDAIGDYPARLRVHLLAMACLEHATELDPRVREEVNERARAILPPRCREEATLLAGVGHLALELLPGPEGLEDDEAQEVIATAALIGSDAAMEVIRRFRHHPATGARYQLARSWQAFDTERYMEEIIRQLDPATFLPVVDAAGLRALKALGGRPCIEVAGPFTSRELLDSLHPRQITHLALTENDEIGSLDFLTEFPALRSLMLVDCPGVGSLAPLAGMPLTTLTVTDRDRVGMPCPDGLHLLKHLRHLNLQVPLPPTGLRALPADAPLTSLILGHPVEAGFSALRHWQQLSALQLRSLTGAFTDGAWDTLAHLPGLEDFSFGLAAGETALRIPTGLRLPQVTTLSAINTAHGPLAELSHSVAAALPAFPALRKLRLYGLTGGTIALPPLTGLPELREVFLSYLRSEPAPELPPHIELTRFPRPRT
ncbi:hypothetical protein SAMN05428954_3166 [Streptomyces sp. 2112.3]|nr:hypothetical protein SAMN05428954_3166 [Streptomyces sp. 2112.3]